jgi:catechol 2,3-dioxygenase-like lactoylglutathione lyase family enzyme
MNFASVRVITDDVDRLVEFYEAVTGISAVRYTPQFAELHFPAFTLAIGHSDTVRLFGSDSAHAADNHSLIVEFLVDDVDTEYERLKPLGFEWVQTPSTMPWGNRSMLFRDPDGNLVNLFKPVTDEAIARLEKSRADDLSSSSAHRTLTGTT